MGKRLGLIIGINNYRDSAFQPLQYAENDARALAQWLANNQGGKWNPPDLQLLLGSHATPELTEALAMQLCLNVAEQGDLVFLYFAGQAFLDETSGEGYLAFANTHNRQSATGLPIRSLVNKAMLHSRATQIVFIFDCFQTGPTWRTYKTYPFDCQPLPGQMLKNTLQQTQGRLLYCSCRGNEYASETGEKNLGTFLFHMIVGLSGPAIDPISGKTTLQNLHAFLSSSLDEQHRPQVFGQEQRPIVLVGEMPALLNGQVKASPSSQAFLTPNSPVVSPSMSNRPAEYLKQSPVSLASAIMSPSTSGQQAFDLHEQERKQRCRILLNQAWQQVQTQNIPGALTTIENILHIVPDCLDALILKGQLLGTIGLFQDALPVANQVVQLDSGNALGWSMCATLLANMGQFQEASVAIERSIAINPSNPEAVEIRDMIRINLARNSPLAQDASSRSTTIPTSKNGGAKSFLIGAVIQILALFVGVTGAALLVVRPQLPIIIAFIFESVGLSVLCVNATRGAYFYGIKRFLFTVVISLLALGIVGGLYRFGFNWFARKVVAFPPLIVPVLFLGLWLATAVVLPVLAAMGGLIIGMASGRRSKGC